MAEETPVQTGEAGNRTVPTTSPRQRVPVRKDLTKWLGNFKGPEQKDLILSIIMKGQVTRNSKVELKAERKMVQL